MAIPNYTYLKLKMPDPKGVITIGTSIQRAYACATEFAELATANAAAEEFADIRAGTTEEAPDSNRKLGSFEHVVADKNTKLVQLDPESAPEKTACIGKGLTPK
ncbi:unnamed protein product [Urochloa humidicola]